MPAAHDVSDAFLLDAKALDLIVDVEEERVVAGRVVGWADQEGAGPGPHQQVHRLSLGEVPVEPGKYGVRVDRFVQVRQQVLGKKG